MVSVSSLFLKLLNTRNICVSLAAFAPQRQEPDWGFNPRDEKRLGEKIVSKIPTPRGFLQQKNGSIVETFTLARSFR